MCTIFHNLSLVKMKKFFYIVLAIFITMLFCGCTTEQPQQSNGDSEPNFTLSDVCLTTNDISQDYIQISEDTEFPLWIDESITSEEVYGVTFSHKNIQHPPGYPVIAVTLVRYQNVEDASFILDNSSKLLISGLETFMENVPLSSVAEIGDESVIYMFVGELGEEYDYQDNVWCFIYFRVNTTVCFIMLSEIPIADIDYESLIIYYAEIIEGRMIKYY